MANARAIVVGGGPAGAAAAQSCAFLGMKVVVVERSNLTEYRPGETLSAQGRRTLSLLDLSGNGIADTVQDTFNRESIWGSADCVCNESIFDPHGHYWTIARPAFDRALLEQIESRGVDVQLGTRVRSASFKDGKWVLTASCGRRIVQFEGDIVIDASGRQSTLFRNYGGRAIYYDSLMGITAARTIEAPYKSILVESIQNGWWYSVRTPGNRLVMTFMTDTDTLSKEGGAQRTWANGLAQATRTAVRWGILKMPERLFVRSARTRTLNKVSGRQWLTVGDAAFSKDPLSGEGIAGALEDGRFAGVNAQSILEGGVPPSESSKKVRAYLRARANIYRLELRWKEFPFWRRRHQPNWATEELNLAPDTIMPNLKTLPFGELERFCPGIEIAVLEAALADRGRTAGEVATAYARIATHALAPEELVACLQFVVEKSGIGHSYGE